jgi:hypothetical protein
MQRSRGSDCKGVYDEYVNASGAAVVQLLMFAMPDCNVTKTQHSAVPTLLESSHTGKPVQHVGFNHRLVFALSSAQNMPISHLCISPVQPGLPVFTLPAP